MRALERAGKWAADIYLVLLGLIIIIGFPIICVVALIYLGAGAAALVGGGSLGIILFFGVPFFILLFFSIYAWNPYVGPAVERVLNALRNSN